MISFNATAVSGLKAMAIMRIAVGKKYFERDFTILNILEIYQYMVEISRLIMKNRLTKQRVDENDTAHYPSRELKKVEYFDGT